MYLPATESCKTLALYPSSASLKLRCILLTRAPYHDHFARVEATTELTDAIGVLCVPIITYGQAPLSFREVALRVCIAGAQKHGDDYVR